LEMGGSHLGSLFSHAKFYHFYVVEFIIPFLLKTSKNIKLRKRHNF
jgi:hypothetical protein